MSKLTDFFCALVDCRGDQTVAERVDEVNQKHRKLGHDLRDLRMRTDALYRLVFSMRSPPDV
jgi:hypothetical protein